jgi:hypothetical protein
MFLDEDDDLFSTPKPNQSTGEQTTSEQKKIGNVTNNNNGVTSFQMCFDESKPELSLKICLTQTDGEDGNAEPSFRM